MAIPKDVKIEIFINEDNWNDVIINIKIYNDITIWKLLIYYICTVNTFITKYNIKWNHIKWNDMQYSTLLI